jgi:hypothetical protein
MTQTQTSRCKASKPVRFKPWHNRKAFRDLIHGCILECAADEPRQIKIYAEIVELKRAQRTTAVGRSKQKAMREYWEDRFADRAIILRHAAKRRSKLEAQWAIIKHRILSSRA